MGWWVLDSWIWPEPQPEVHQMKLVASDMAERRASSSYLGDVESVGVKTRGNGKKEKKIMGKRDEKTYRENVRSSAYF